MAKQMRIVLAGGGSGGHVLPLLALVPELKKNKAELLWVGDGSDMTKDLVRKAGINQQSVSSGKWRRYFALENIITPLKLLSGFMTAVQILKKFKPDVVVTKGGYASFPIVLAAKQLGIPLVAHESDAVMGRANRFASRFAAKICVSYPKSYYKDLPADRVVETGVPIRPDFFVKPSTKKVSDIPILLVTGGSQGAQRLNQVVIEALPKLLPTYSIVHLTGQRDFAMCQLLKKTGYEPVAFTDDMPRLMHQADLVISRSGSILAEIAATGKPAILVPLPESVDANAHQLADAKVWQEQGAGILLRQADLSAASLTATIEQLFKSPKKLSAMANAAHTLAHPDAVEKIIRVIEQVAAKG